MTDESRFEDATTIATIKRATDTTKTTTTGTTTIKSPIATSTMFAQQEHKSKQTEKMLEQATQSTTTITITKTTTKSHQTAQINGNKSEKIKENGINIDNNNINVAGSVDSGVGDVGIGIIKGDIPDALGFTNEKSIAKKKIEHIAHMPVERNATYYNMNHKNRGHALIFNHETFDIPDLKPRKGTEKDCENLRQTLLELDFDVAIYNDCKIKEIFHHVDKVSSEDHTDNDCILIAILSHGDHGYIYAKDVQYKLDSIANYFTANNCPSLAGKPKLFFIQACRGDRFDAGIMMQRTETDGESSTSYKIPVHADFLFVYSTIPGFYSWRSPIDGSWFIQALVRELKNNGKVHDMLTLLTFVNQRVAFDYASYVPDHQMMHDQKQIPCITSMLTRILRFTDKTYKVD